MRRFSLVIPCAAVLLALIIDAAGLLLDAAALHRAGAQLAQLAIALGALAWIARMMSPTTRRGLVLWLIGLLMLALARWVRGSAAVPPDAPLVGLQVLGCALLLWGARRALVSAPPQSRADAPPPAAG